MLGKTERLHMSQLASDTSPKRPEVAELEVARAQAACPADPQVRPECEDDDGYDPWSDRRDEQPLFEPDPWA